MSSLTTETVEVWVVIKVDIAHRELEIAEYPSEVEAVQRAQEEIAYYVEQFNTFCHCKIEHRVVPIYK
jgi:hypothetical protein